MDTTTALSGRAGLAGVQSLLLAAPAQQALRDALLAMMEDGANLGAIALHRAKYKPGRHLTAYYALELRDPASGQAQERQIEVKWRPASAEAPREDKAAQAMQAEAIERGLAAPFKQLSSSVAEWGMAIRVAPLDPDFPQLVRASDPAHVQAMLASNGAQAGSYNVTTIRYRPGQRHVLRYNAAGANGPAADATVFAKIYNSDKGARTYDVVTRVADWLVAQDAGITTVRPLGYVAGDGAVLYPCVTGTPISSLLQNPDVDVDQPLRLAGAALQALHHTPLDLIELQPHSFAKEIKGITSASEHLHALLPETGALIASILTGAQALHDQLPQEPPAFAYGDFKADHLWVTTGGLTLIDFDTCYLFDPAIDLGKFLADLHWWYDRAQRPGVAQARAAFLAGYGETSPARIARARLYELLVLIKSTVRRVRLFDADWEARTTRLIGIAERLFHALQEEIAAHH